MEPKVMIAVPTGEVNRYSNFFDHYLQLNKPLGTLHMFAHGQSPAKNRNVMIQAALDNECTHILFIDDDVIPPPDLLTKLLAWDKDIVTGMYPMRNFPHYPVVFDKRYANGFNRHVHLKDEVAGLIPISNCGFGCVLIKIDVFKTLRAPWVTLGELEKDGWCDDIAFFNKAYDAGIQMFCDTEVVVDHMMAVYVGFRRVDGKWVINYDCRGQGNLQFPITYPEADIDIARKIEGWLSETELNWLGVVSKKYTCILEVGSYKGKSTRVFADNSPGYVIAIDSWNCANKNNIGNISHYSDETTYAEFTRNLKEYIDIKKVIPFKTTFEEYDWQGFSHNGFIPELIFIDADHEYHAVRRHIDKALSMNPKVISGHDYAKEWPGVKTAVDETFGNKVNTVDTIWWVECRK